MGFGRRNDELNPPGSLQPYGQGAFQIREGETVYGGQVSPPSPNGSGTHFMPTPNVSPAISSCPDMDGMYQSYPYDPRIGNNSMTGVIRPNYLQSPLVDPSFGAFGGGLRKVDACSSGLHSSQVNVNVVASESSSVGGYQMNVPRREAEVSTSNRWAQVPLSSLNLGCGASMSSQNADVVQAGVDNDIKVTSIDAGKLDGSFLTLGKESNAEGRNKRMFDPKIASKMEEGAGPRNVNSQIRPATNVHHNLTSDLSSSNTNRESRTKRKFDPREISRKLEETGGPKTSISPAQPVLRAHLVHDEAAQAAIADPYFGRQLPGPFKQRHILENPCESTDVLDNSMGKHLAEQSYVYSQVDPPPFQFQLNNTYSGLSPGYTRPPDLESENSKHAWVTNPPTRDLLGISNSRNAGDVSSSLGRDSSNARGSFITRDYLGISTFPSQSIATLAGESGPQSTGARFNGQSSSSNEVVSVHAFGNSALHNKAGPPIAESSLNQPAMGAPFPRRLGVQPNDASATASVATRFSNQSLSTMNIGALTNSSRYPSWDPRASQAANYRPIYGHQARFPAQSNYLPIPPFLSGPGRLPPAPSQVLVPQSPSQFTAPQAPSQFTAPQAPSQAPVVLPRGMHSPGQMLTNYRAAEPSQVYARGDSQSLKRKASESPGVPSWGRRKRLISVAPNSMRGIPINTSTQDHLRWTGFDNPPPPKPIGFKCLLCRRDLSFAPEGVESQPGNPPPVAVLPCGHRFHDHCLQVITPEDQAHDPPCIPCAIGEK